MLDLQPHWTKQHVVDLTLGQINPNGYSKWCLTPELTCYASLSLSILIYCWVEWKLWLMGRNHHSAYVDLCVLQCKTLHHCVFSVCTHLINSGSVRMHFCIFCTACIFYFFIKNIVWLSMFVCLSQKIVSVQQSLCKTWYNTPQIICCIVATCLNIYCRSI